MSEGARSYLLDTDVAIWLDGEPHLVSRQVLATLAERSCDIRSACCEHGEFPGGGRGYLRRDLKAHLLGEDAAERGEVDVEVVVFGDVCVDAEVAVPGAAGEGVEVTGGPGLRV